MTKGKGGKLDTFFCGSLFLDCRKAYACISSPLTYISSLPNTLTTPLTNFHPHPPIMFSKVTASSMPSETPHPFYPIGVEIAGYLANDKDTMTLFGIALAGLAVICSATWTIVSRVSPGLRTRDKLTILWFISSRPLPSQTYSVQANACQQPALSTSSSRATSPLIIPAWHPRQTSSGRCGRNTPTQTRDTSLQTHSSCVWRLSLRLVPSQTQTTPLIILPEPS